ncbi:MAG TPA: hypoxanthine phosphoribosyltransferase [Persephonella sp.]|nr:hypoxanthine phosphoribosyltransferase [Persephonella sp.]
MPQIKGRPLELLIPSSKIEERIQQLGKKISEDFKNEEIFAIGILKGSFMFFADLVRNIDTNVYIDFMQVSSYHTNMESSGEVIFVKDISIDINNKNVLIIDDIIDTGRTLKALTMALKQRNPKNLRTCVLLDKKGRREVDFNADYVGFEIPDKFVVGYGLDWAEEGRNFKDVYCVIT